MSRSYLLAYSLFGSFRSLTQFLLVSLTLYLPTPIFSGDVHYVCICVLLQLKHIYILSHTFGYYYLLPAYLVVGALLFLFCSLQSNHCIFFPSVTFLLLIFLLLPYIVLIALRCFCFNHHLRPLFSLIFVRETTFYMCTRSPQSHEMHTRVQAETGVRFISLLLLLRMWNERYQNSKTKGKKACKASRKINGKGPTYTFAIVWLENVSFF